MFTPLKKLDFESFRFMAEIWNTQGGGSLEFSKGLAMRFIGQSREGWYWLQDQAPESVETMLTPLTEEDVKFWARHHFGWVYVIWSQGWGVTIQQPHQKAMTDLIKLCHKHDIRVGAYFSVGNMFHRTFTREFPDAAEWAQINPDGSPSLYSGTPERYMTCLNRQEWMNYHREEIKRAVEAGADALFFDNVGFACHCDVCRRKFREYTLRRLGKACDILSGGDWSDPLVRVLAEFQGECVAETMKQICEWANSSRYCPVSFNAHTNIYYISAWAGLPCSTQNRAEDFIQSEDKASIRYWPGGPEEYPPNDIELYKYETKFGKHFMHHAPHNGHDWPFPNLARLLLAQAAAFHSAVCFVTPEKEPYKTMVGDAVCQYLEFVETNMDYYLDAESMAEVAVLYSHPNIYWHLLKGERKLPNLNGFDRVLIEGHVPFDFILEDEVLTKTLEKYKVLVTPNTAVMSDATVDAIREFVRKGGGLVATGETSLYTEVIEKRADYGLADVFNCHLGDGLGPKGLGRKEFVIAKGIIDETSRNEFGKGRAIFFSDHPDREYLNAPVVQTRGRLLEAVRWAMGGPPTFSAEIPSSIFIAPYRQMDRIILHYVNYRRDMPPGLDGDEPIYQKNIKVALRIPEPKQVRFISPDGPVPDVAVSEKHGAIYFTLPELRIYALGIVELY